VYGLFQAILCSLLCSSFEVDVILTYPIHVQQIHILCKYGDGTEAHLTSMRNEADVLTCWRVWVMWSKRCLHWIRTSVLCLQPTHEAFRWPIQIPDCTSTNFKVGHLPSSSLSFSTSFGYYQAIQQCRFITVSHSPTSSTSTTTMGVPGLPKVRGFSTSLLTLKLIYSRFWSQLGVCKLWLSLQWRKVFSWIPTVTTWFVLALM